jgi:RimJ/RimL family protein N-acetyltransferase
MMVPLEPEAAQSVSFWLGPERPGLLALRHALRFGRPGLWGDDARSPQSVLLVREGDGQLEAFGAGKPDEAVGWLSVGSGSSHPSSPPTRPPSCRVGEGQSGGAQQRRPIATGHWVGSARRVALVAPEAWGPLLQVEVGAVDRMEVETFVLRDRDRFRPERGPGPRARKLTLEDGPAFEAIAPAWALRGWGSFAALIEHGSAFGVPGPGGAGLVALAWVFDATERFEAVGVFTVDRLRGLGLGRRVATALVEHILSERGKVPLWSTSPANTASRTLARSLGFSGPTREPLWRWVLCRNPPLRNSSASVRLPSDQNPSDEGNGFGSD